jgi:acetyltransferase-like isoleucine patch superfamily enzyme
MDRSLIIEYRKKVHSFFEGTDAAVTIKVECPVRERIKFIYQVIFPGIHELAFYIRFTLARVAQRIDFSWMKVVLYKIIGVRIGKGVYISPDVIIDPHFPTTITLKDHCILGWGAKLFSHEFMDKTYRIGRITIEEEAIVGAYATIRGGVTIGKAAEVPYGSIMIKDVLPGTLARSLAREMLARNSR